MKEIKKSKMKPKKKKKRPKTIWTYVLVELFKSAQGIIPLFFVKDKLSLFNNTMLITSISIGLISAIMLYRLMRVNIQRKDNMSYFSIILDSKRIDGMFFILIVFILLILYHIYNTDIEIFKSVMFYFMVFGTNRIFYLMLVFLKLNELQFIHGKLYFLEKKKSDANAKELEKELKKMLNKKII